MRIPDGGAARLGTSPSCTGDDETDRIACAARRVSRSLRRAGRRGRFRAGGRNSRPAHRRRRPIRRPPVPAALDSGCGGRGNAPNAAWPASMSAQLRGGDVVLYHRHRHPTCLSLRMGAPFNVERELLIYLRVKPGASPRRPNWLVARDPACRGHPQVVNVGRPTRGSAPSQADVSHVATP